MTDRGLHYGDGVFETIACLRARPVFIDQHLNRMSSAAAKLDIPFPDRQLILNDIDGLLRGATANSVIKLILTRGRGKRGYRYQKKQLATRICMHSEWPDQVDQWRQNGVKAQFCETPVSVNPVLGGIKTLNRLENVLASHELGAGIDEGFMLDADGNVIEGTMSNIFAVIDDALVTPDVSRCGIEGIMREQIIDIADKNTIKVEVRDINREEFQQAAEIFICNSVIGLCTVKQLEQRVYTSENMTNTINMLLQRRIEADAKAAA